MARRIPKCSRRLNRLLKTDPHICLIRTPAGIYRTHRQWFTELCNLPWLVRLAPRIATVADGYAVIISDKEFYAYRTTREPIGPRMKTFTQLIDEMWILKCESRSLSPLERERETAKQYGLQVVFEAV